MKFLTGLKTALTHQYKDMKTTQKNVKKDWLHPPETIPTTEGWTERQYLEYKKWEQKNYMDIISD